MGLEKRRYEVLIDKRVEEDLENVPNHIVERFLHLLDEFEKDPFRRRPKFDTKSLKGLPKNTSTTKFTSHPKLYPQEYAQSYFPRKTLYCIYPLYYASRRREEGRIRRIFVIWVCILLCLAGLAAIAVFETPIHLVENASGATTLYVNKTGSGGAYTSIQVAVDAASDGDLVYVYTGTYYEHLIVNTSVSIMGEDKNSVTIDGGGTGTTVFINEDSVEFSQFTVKGAGTEGKDKGIKINMSDYCIVSNNIVLTGKGGISAGYSDYNDILNNYISTFGNGISTSFSNYNTFSGNIISGCSVGMYILWSEGHILSDNIVSNNQGGIWIWDNDKCTITNNTLSANLDQGILIRQSNENIVEYNRVFDHPYAGIALTFADKNHLSHNNISNSTDGFHLYDSDRNVISYNDVFSNGQYGFYFENARDNKIYYNNIRNNSIQAIDDRWNHWNDSYPMGGNYWDDYSGVDEKNGPLQDKEGKDGLGDTKYVMDSDSKDHYPLMGPIETIPPRFYLKSPENISIIKNSEVFDFVVHDEDLELVTYSFDLGLTQPLSEPFNISLSNLNDGVHLLTISAEDQKNNFVSRNYVFTIDSTKPVITLISPENNALIPSGTLLDFSVEDSNILDVSYSIDNGDSVPLNGSYNISTEGWVDDIYLVRIDAVDKAGNHNTSEYSFTLDSNIPVIQLISPGNNIVIKNGTLLDFEIDDFTLDIVKYSINGGEYSVLPDPYDISTDEWDDGGYTIEINATDSLSNSNSRLFFFYIDSIPPVIRINQSVNHSTVRAGQMLYHNITDLHLKNAYYSFTGQVFFLLKDPYIGDTSGLGNGAHRIWVKAIDSAQNEVMIWYDILIDSKAPAVVSSNIKNGSKDIPINTTVIITFSEPMSMEDVEDLISIAPFNDYDLFWDENKTELYISFKLNNMAFGTSYNLTIDSQLTDAVGNPMTSEFILSFSTVPKSSEPEDTIDTQNDQPQDDNLMWLLLLLGIIIAVIIIILLFVKRGKNSQKGQGPIKIKVKSKENSHEKNIKNELRRPPPDSKVPPPPP